MNETELRYLRRCVELATEALDAGDEPFGSVLVGGDGSVLAEDVVPDLVVEGPVPGLAEQVRALHRRFHGAS